ncbi:hypothetical protein OF83DRAFT_775032, partial [Amylostereum chailletii]
MTIFWLGQPRRLAASVATSPTSASISQVERSSPRIPTDEVAVPERLANILAYPERFTTSNIEKLKKAVRNGCDVHPGANHVTASSSGFKKHINFGNRNAIADGLRYG